MDGKTYSAAVNGGDFFLSRLESSYSLAPEARLLGGVCHGYDESAWSGVDTPVVLLSGSQSPSTQHPVVIFN